MLGLSLGGRIAIDFAIAHPEMGDRDVPTIGKIVGILTEGIPNATKVVIPGAGHVVNMEKPDEFNRAVLDFLQHH